MNRPLNGVYLNEMQGSPFQPDVNFRGHTASPLLGTPEGISVCLAGVRQNQPFGDLVSWDLILEKTSVLNCLPLEHSRPSAEATSQPGGPTLGGLVASRRFLLGRAGARIF
jgi:hypothetical protein